MYYYIILNLCILFISIFSAEQKEEIITQIQNFSILKISKFNIPNVNIRNKRLDSFCNIYNDKNTPFWGEVEGTTYYSEKQKALKEKIKEIIDCDNQIETILTKALLIHPSKYKKEYVMEMNQLRVPVYYGYVVTPRDEIHYKNIWEKKAPNDANKIWTGDTIPAFYTGLFPWYYYNKNKQELKEKKGELLGIVFSNGVNFESIYTTDFKRFLDKNGNIQYYEKTNLEIYIQEIADNIVYSGIELTKQSGKKNCYFRMPKIGLRCFCKAFKGGLKENKTELITLYLTAYYNALAKYSTENDDMKIHIDFFEFQGDHVDADYEKEYKKIFNNPNKPTNLSHAFFPGNIFDASTGSPEIKDNADYQTIIAHAGDSHSFLGNGGIHDGSLEQKLLGLGNDDYLTPAHILNLFFGEFFKDQIPKTEEQLTDIQKEEVHQIKKTNTVFYLKFLGIIIILATVVYNKKYIYENIVLQLIKSIKEKH
jgi:hypothetical protein